MTKLEMLWKGNWKPLYNSHSEADMAFCRMLQKEGKTSSEIDKCMRSSGLMRDKWDEKRGENTYGELTIKKIMETI